MVFEYTDNLEKIGRMTEGYIDPERNAKLYIGGGDRGYHRNTLIYEYEGQVKRLEISIIHDDVSTGKFSLLVERCDLQDNEKDYLRNLIQDSVSSHLNDRYGAFNPTFDINQVSL